MSNEDFEALIARIRALPPEKLEEVEEVLEWLERRDTNVYELSDEERADLNEALAEMDRGEVATAEEVEAVLGRLPASCKP